MKKRSVSAAFSLISFMLSVPEFFFYLCLDLADAAKNIVI
ncbi:putative membrane protein [Acinetobacter baumannii 45075_3]|nr:putative membrane protein [Acinetobacter baumannii 1202252]EXC54759.1 putative membrane protein [Acinetobacter baumannii 1032241]EXC97013.1 putative membrane protein [Acinetobacter baumannii 1075025]EXD94791.1 putative membrane protein [Acinetobacter baumannii 942194]EXE45781.1 putative membrane protein [Acinetobacter baumannii 43926]EXE82026.1 putative membrane protein [Acinetobacter baumannii 42887]EXQ84985.1 putative membrane protein [Acinetobacter baumannii 1058283]EYD26149.1 putative